MAQHDYVIDNQTAPSFRSDLNSALSAIVTLNGGGTAPATTYANMLWYDSSANILKMRNEADDAWIALGTLNQTANRFELDSTVFTGTPTAPTPANNVSSTQLATTAYVTNRRNIFVASGGTTTDLTGSFENRLSASFTANSDFIQITAQGSIVSLGNVNDLVAEIRLYDTVSATNASVVQFGSTTTVNGSYAFVSPFCFSLFYGSLTVGRTYQAQLWLRKTQATGPFSPQLLQIGGVAF